MKKTKQVPESDLETKVRWLLDYEHRITVDSECEFGDHWYCSCGKSDLDSYSGHLTEEIMVLINCRKADPPLDVLHDIACSHANRPAGHAFNFDPQGILSDCRYLRAALAPIIDSWTPQHTNYCARQDDDADCVCGVGPEYERLLRAALATPAPEELCGDCMKVRPFPCPRHEEADLPEGFFTCPLCGTPERKEDEVVGLCLACSDAIAFEQHNRRSRIIVVE